MKSKLSKLLLTIILVIPIVVFALPYRYTQIPYEVSISDKNGAYLYDNAYEKTDILLNRNTKVKIIDEENRNLFYGKIIYNNRNYYIDLSKVKLTKDNFTFDDLKKSLEYLKTYNRKDYEAIFRNVEYGFYGLVYNSEATIYKGPSEKYEKTNIVIKDGDIIYFNDIGLPWIYVEKDGVSGWIKESNDFEIIQKGPYIWLKEDAVAYHMPKYGKFTKTIVTIPKDTKFEETYSLYYEVEKDDDIDSVLAYAVKYNDDIYYILEEKSIVLHGPDLNDGKIITERNVTAYDEIKGKEVASIPFNTMLDVEYYYDTDSKEYNWLYVKYNNDHYWIIDDDSFYENLADGKIITLKETDCHEINFAIKTDITIPVNTQFDNSYYDSETYAAFYNNKLCYLDKSVVAHRCLECLGLGTDMIIYDEVNGTKTDNILPKDTRVCPIYSFVNKINGNKIGWYYIDEDGYKGWIDIYDTSITKTNDSNTTEKEIINTEEEKPVINNEEKSDNKTTLIYVLSGIAFILIILVSKLIINIKYNKKIDAIKTNDE